MWNWFLSFKGCKKTNFAIFIFADSMHKENSFEFILLIGNLRDFYKYFITEIRNKTNENKKRDNFCGIYFCDWSSGNVLRNLFWQITKNNSILQYLFLCFRDKSAKINTALINFEKINSTINFTRFTANITLN